MSQDPGPWEKQTANQESQQEKEAAFEQKWAEKERKWAEMKAEVEASNQQQTGNQQQTSNQQGAWAHWDYTHEEWALFEKVDWMPIRLTFWGLVGGFVASVIAIIQVWFIPDVVKSPLFGVFFLGVLGFCVFLPFMFLYHFPYIDARKRHKARQQVSRTVTFSKEGVWEAGTFFSLDAVLKVQRVTLTSDPPVLHFRLAIGRNEKYWPPSDTSSILHIPIPRGQEEEAGLLLKRFQTVIQERAQREKQWEAQRNNPPEPRFGRRE